MEKQIKEKLEIDKNNTNRNISNKQVNNEHELDNL